MSSNHGSPTLEIDRCLRRLYVCIPWLATGWPNRNTLYTATGQLANVLVEQDRRSDLTEVP